jgi:ABC-type lipoprotein release transport system permease subunit
MSAVRMRVRGDVRRRMGSLIAVALILGGLGTVAMAGVAGARRTETAYARYREATRQPEAEFVSCAGGIPFPYVDTNKVAALPGVASLSRAVYAVVTAQTPEGTTLFFAPDDPFEVNMLIPRQTIDWRPKLLAGRYPDPTASDEVLMSWSTGRKYPRPSVGSTIDITLPSPSMLGQGGPPGDGETVRVHVVGEIITPNSLKGDDVSLIATPAFLAEHPASGYGHCDFAVVQLSGGMAAIPAFTGQLQAIGPAVQAGSALDEETFFSRATHLRVVVYQLFGFLIGFLALTLVGQAIIRRTQLAGIEDPVLQAIGMTRGQRFRSAFLPGAAAGVVGTLLAIIGAVLVSAAFPTGIARMIESTRGISVDLQVIGLGALIMLAGTLGAAAIPAWRGSRGKGSASLGTAEFSGPRSGSRTAAALSRAGAPPTVIAGARFALEPGHGRSSVPVRSAILGLAIAVAAVSGGLVFAASMNRFQNDDALRGGSAAFGAGHPFIGTHFQNDIMPVFREEPGIGRLTAGNFQNRATASGPEGQTIVTIWGLSPIRGAIINPTVLEGRWPSAEDEIVLGKTSARAIGVGIGDQVTLTGGTAPAKYLVVGTVVLPEFGFGPGLGGDAGMSMDGLHRLFPGTVAPLNLALGEYAPGAHPTAVAERVNSHLDVMCAGLPTSTPLERADQKACPWGIHVDPPGSGTIQDLAHSPGATAIVQSKNLPLALALLFAIAAAATLIHVLVTSIRRRRRDVAILKTLGFSRRQVLVTIEWQAALLAFAATLIGVPLGVLLGRWGWALFADRLGIGIAIVVPWMQVLLIAPVAVGLAMVIAVGPALAARRTKAAVVLRTE